MSSYHVGGRPPGRPFPVVPWLVTVTVLAAVGGGTLWHFTRQETTEIRNAAPVTRTVTVPPAD